MTKLIIFIWPNETSNKFVYFGSHMHLSEVSMINMDYLLIIWIKAGIIQSVPACTQAGRHMDQGSCKSVTCIQPPSRSWHGHCSLRKQGYHVPKQYKSYHKALLIIITVIMGDNVLGSIHPSVRLWKGGYYQSEGDNISHTCVSVIRWHLRIISWMRSIDF